MLDLLTSDVCAGWPGTGPYAAIQAAHAAIGGLVVLIPWPLRLTFLGGWIGKELSADIAGCDWSSWVALDSVADLGFAALGLALAYWIRTAARAEV